MPTSEKLHNGSPAGEMGDVAVPDSTDISILTDPLWIGPQFWTEPAKQSLAAVTQFLMRQGAARRYRGHPAVTRSLVEGLRAIGVPVQYNPRRINQLSPTVVVLCNVTALRQMIALKRQGVVRKLLAGPNMMSFSDMYDGVFGDEAIDIWLAPSRQVCDLYVRDCAAIAGRCRVWPAGVDTSYWQPMESSRRRRKAIVYVKTHVFPHMTTESVPIEMCRRVLSQRGYEVQMIRYGEYSEAEYLRSLQGATLMVGFTASESQGLAWAEAWAVNVPTLIWYRDKSICFGRAFATSAAPYLSDETGAFFTDEVTFRAGLEKLESRQHAMWPRDWVVGNMSVEVATRAFCSLAGILTLERAKQ